MQFSKYTILTLFFGLIAIQLAAQTGTVRGNIFDAETGEPVMFGSVTLVEINKSTTTNTEGFFNLAKVPAGTYTLYCSYIGYDSISVQINVVSTSKTCNTCSFTTPSGHDGG